MTDFCPNCNGLLLTTYGTRVAFQAKCTMCQRVYELDDNYDPILPNVNPWIVASGVVAVLMLVAL